MLYVFTYCSISFSWLDFESCWKLILFLGLWILISLQKCILLWSFIVDRSYVILFHFVGNFLENGIYFLRKRIVFTDWILLSVNIISRLAFAMCMFSNPSSSKYCCYEWYRGLILSFWRVCQFDTNIPDISSNILLCNMKNFSFNANVISNI